MERLTDEPSGGALDVLVVARWYPSVADPVRGRFVADQVAALVRTGRVRPRVVVAEPVTPGGRDDAERDARTAALRDYFARGVAGHPALFAAAGWAGAPGVPVARLGVVEANRRRDGRPGTVASRQAALRALASRLSAMRPDLVHAHGLFPDGIAAAELAARLGVPFVLTEHSSTFASELDDPGVRAMAADAVAGAAAILAVGAALAAEIRSLLPVVAGLVEIEPNAVDAEAFHAAPIAGRDPESLLWVGSRLPAKGIETLLRAFALVRTARPGATLRLIGAAPKLADDAAWRDLARQLGIADAVAFEPSADRAGVAAAMARASVFVHPSRRETFGVVVAEALASGLPVVATRTGAARLLEPDVEAVGALADVDDAAGLADAVLRVLRQRGSYDPERLRARVVGRFDAETVAGSIADRYNRIVGRHGTARRAPAGAPVGVAGRPGPWDGARRLVILATNRPRAESLGALPAGLLAGAVVVAPASAVPAMRSAGLDLRPFDARPAGRLRRMSERLAGSAGRDPSASGATVAATRVLEQLLPDAEAGPGRDRDAGQDPGRAAAQGAAPGAGTAPGAGAAEGEPPELLPIDGADAIIALPSIDAGRAVPLPGSTGWLADRVAAGPGAS